MAGRELTQIPPTSQLTSGAWLDDLDYIDLEQRTLQTIDN